jgi:hypothetical protein
LFQNPLDQRRTVDRTVDGSSPSGGADRHPHRSGAGMTLAPVSDRQCDSPAPTPQKPDLRTVPQSVARHALRASGEVWHAHLPTLSRLPLSFPEVRPSVLGTCGRCRAVSCAYGRTSPMPALWPLRIPRSVWSLVQRMRVGIYTQRSTPAWGLCALRDTPTRRMRKCP